MNSNGGILSEGGMANSKGYGLVNKNCSSGHGAPPYKLLARKASERIL